MLNYFRFIVLLVSLGTLASLAGSCKDDEDSTNAALGAISGKVVDGDGQPVSGVAITVTDVEGTVTSGSDGTYTVPNVTVETHAVVFTKSGYRSETLTVTVKSFDANHAATASISMLRASAKITGTVIDGQQDARPPLAGAVVTMGTLSVTTGADGKYTFSDLVVDNYTLTFSKSGYTAKTLQITSANFSNEEAVADMLLGAAELLPNLTAVDLKDAEKWYYSEYRGGRNDAAYPHWDWSSDYMSTLDLRGNWEEQNEGTTLRIRNDGDQQQNPADTDVFDSFVFGSKQITEDNKILTLRVRTHGADEKAPAHFGVQVIDLSEAEPQSQKVGSNRMHGSGDYADYTFDLSPYIGKEVIVAIGIYRAATGDYWKQLVLRRIAFAKAQVSNWDWVSENGAETEVIEGWKLTKEMVRSTMPHTKNTFTGISPTGGNRDNYIDGYRSWRTVNHIAAEWSFVPLKKDCEPFASQGYVIKTRGTAETSTTVPEAYLYAKFSIKEGSNKLTLKTRNFPRSNGDLNYLFFKLTAIDNAGTVTHLQPVSNNATEALAVGDGCWKFKHAAGEKDNPDAYASFQYNLASFNGREVTLVLGVYNGAANTSENKLSIYSVELK